MRIDYLDGRDYGTILRERLFKYGGKKMYEYIKGIVTYISPYYIVIETHGIGYQILVANPFKFSSYRDKQVTLYLYQAVREDAMTLYGFETLEEKQLFLKLISVSGIGPKSGLAIMASADHAGLVTAIENADHSYLTKFPGVGKKTAQQMVLDLKGKLGDVNFEPSLVGQQQLEMDSEFTAKGTISALEEACEALKALGYSAREISKVKKGLAAENLTTTDEYLRKGLSLLMKK